MRFAPPVRAQQFEAMKLRNDILAIEQKLQKLDEDNSLLSYIKPENFPRLKGFNIKDVENFINIYSSLKPYEKAYFDHFTAFIAKEPVSYTHLDVYKRQPFKSVNSINEGSFLAEIIFSSNNPSLISPSK